MTNRGAIENLKGCVVSYELDEHGRPNGNVTADLTMEIINLAISALEKQEQDRWIPCDERLPEKEGCYLVTVKNDHKRKYSKTAWYSGDGWFARQDIIAWRLTPEPYTEEEA